MFPKKSTNNYESLLLFTSTVKILYGPQRKHELYLKRFYEIFSIFFPKKDCNLNRICRTIFRGKLLKFGFEAAHCFLNGPLVCCSCGCTHYPPLFPILSKFKCEFVKAMAPFTVVQHLFVIQNHFGFSCLFRVGTLGDHY